MSQQSNIAILFFSRTAAREGLKKTWFTGESYHKNKLLASSLIAQSLSAIEKASFPVYHYHEGKQQGNTFGERIANAYQEVFALGYDAIIGVGNDTPEIVQLDWGGIAMQLCAGNTVLGPSLRGGSYLIGLKAETFDRQAFEQLPWQSSQLFQALHDWCENNGTDPVLLSTRRDVNTYLDLEALRQSTGVAKFALQLIAALAGTRPPAKWLQRPPYSSITPFLNLPFRAPPVLG